MTQTDEGMDGLAAQETVVTPTRRLAHYLRNRWDEACAARGLAVWRTPDIVTWDELIERAVLRDRQAGRLRGRWLSSAAAQLKWDRIVRSDPGTQHLVGSEGLAARAYLSWRRLNEYLIPVTALDELGSPETAAFRRWVARYSKWLDSGSWLDPARASTLVSAQALDRRMRMTGFDRFTPAQEAFLTRIEREGVAIDRTPVPEKQGRLVRVNCKDIEDETERAVRWAASRLDSEPGIRLAIVVPELQLRHDELRRKLDRVLAPAATLTGGALTHSELFELASAAPLTRAPVVGAGLELLDSMIDEDDAGYRVGRLLHSHFIRGAEIEASQRARLDIWRRGRSRRVPTVRRLQAAAASHGCPDLALALAAGVEKMEKWPKKDSATNWAHEFFSLLSVLGWPGEQLASQEMQALQRWQDLLAEFGASDEIVGMLPAGEALGLLRNMTARAMFEPEQPRGPLLVIDPETCAGMHFDGLWLCGLESGRWPPPARPDPFLPFAWQVRQQVPGSTPDLCLQHAERLLQGLASSAAEVIASVPAQNADAPLQPSPLVADWPAEGLHSLWQPASVAAASFASRPELEHLDDPAMPAIRLAGAVNGGARALELQAGCGFRAQAELRLGARAIEEMTPGLDAGTRGTLAHEVLEDLWRKLGDSVALARHSPESLGRLLAGVVAARLASHVDVADPIGRRMLEFEAGWLQEQIMRLLDADRGRAPFAVASLEESCLLRIGGLELRLRPDRIDRLEDGSLALIDYKTGGDAELRAWFDERPALPQLPLYVEAIGAASVSAVAFGKLRAGQTGYLGLARSAGLFAGLQTFADTRLAKGIDTWEEMLATWRRRLELLAREHRGGDARLAANPQKACTYCGLSMLCRKNDTTPWPGQTDDP